MLPQIPLWLDALFGLLVLGVLIRLLRLIRPLPGGTSIALGLVAWLVLTGGIAFSGVLLTYQDMPPKVALLLFPTFIATILIGLSRRASEWIRLLPPETFISFQGFRFKVEIVLWLLLRESVIPRDMTFEGRNFDILTGISAPFIAILYYRSRRLPRGAVLAWNVAGLLLLTNVVTHAVLAMPTRFRVLTDDLPNLIPGSFPFVWLPVFLVPLALLFHILSIRALLRDSLPFGSEDASKPSK